MNKGLEDTIRERLTKRHQGDQKQLEVIFSPIPRILVEAPAGYGKTNTMVSKIAYLIASGQIPNPKKLLALTFSVNAAYKIKKDVASQIPILLEGLGKNFSINEKIAVSNYHGFCRNVLKKYGWVFHDSLIKIQLLESIDDTKVEATQKRIDGLSYDDALFMSKFSTAVKDRDNNFIKANLAKYNKLIVKQVLPAGCITYNGILTLTLKLFSAHPNVLKFYHEYFPLILVDEYQDTNILSFALVTRLISKNTKVILLGDSLQRIYGFIGAVENLLAISERKFLLSKISLTKNYRFASNPQMLLLDTNIRRNAENLRNPVIITDANIPFKILPDQEQEALKIVKTTLALLKKNPDAKVAILVKQRGNNVDTIINCFHSNSIEFFFGLFTDEDSTYVQFHKNCSIIFKELIQDRSAISKKLSGDHLQKIKDAYSKTSDSTTESLLKLLEVFWRKFFIDSSSLNYDEKIDFINDAFDHNGLKQYLEFIGTNILISTVHAAKGLEWDFVILPDMEQDSFPNWAGICNSCLSKKDCRITITDKNEAKYLEELSVFYVAVTRAKKQVYFTASETAPDKYGNQRYKNISCLLGLPGITY